MESPAHELTELLQAWSEGDQDAIEKLMPLVYGELHRLAHRYMADERPGHTLQTTALVHEAYLRLLDSAHLNWQGRAQFFAVCAGAMRRILVDFSRTRRAAKRGSGGPAIQLQEAMAVAGGQGADVVAVDEALKSLAVQDPRKGQIVELRFFGGLSVQETAEVMKISQITVLRDWKLAKSWLRRELMRG